MKNATKTALRPRFKLVPFDRVTSMSEPEWERHCRQNRADMSPHRDDLTDAELDTLQKKSHR